jgi:hypothetical protein
MSAFIAKRYQARFAGTYAFLPERNGIRPDALHVAFHIGLIATVALVHQPALDCTGADCEAAWQ